MEKDLKFLNKYFKDHNMKVVDEFDDEDTDGDGREFEYHSFIFETDHTVTDPTDEFDDWNILNNLEYYTDFDYNLDRGLYQGPAKGNQFEVRFTRALDEKLNEEVNNSTHEYDVLLCDNESSGSRGTDYDSFESINFKAKDLEDAFRYIYLNEFDFEDEDIDDYIDEYGSLEEYEQMKDNGDGTPYICVILEDDIDVYNIGAEIGIEDYGGCIDRDDAERFWGPEYARMVDEDGFITGEYNYDDDEEYED